MYNSSEFGQMVAHEYLKIFDFEGLELDECLRQFLMSFTLSGETQERERIMVHFSHRFFECNPYSFPSYGNSIIPKSDIDFYIRCCSWHYMCIVVA